MWEWDGFRCFYFWESVCCRPPPPTEKGGKGESGMEWKVSGPSYPLPDKCVKVRKDAFRFFCLIPSLLPRFWYELRQQQCTWY